MLQPPRPLIGKKEWCALPELGLPALKARIDSGARTSALHAFNLTTEKDGDEQWVSFDIHPIQKNRKITRQCTARIVDERSIKSSSGHAEKRIVIATPLTLGADTWEIEVTLTNRDQMGHRMLIGRQAMQNRVLIDPAGAYMTKQISRDEAKRLYGGG
jgi:ribosomal protein S6--L-glutamate ligase